MKIIEHNLDEELAIKLMGWKWMAYDGKPIKGHPGYPNDCRVRRLFSKSQLESERWIEYLKEHNGAEATGDEPLAYCYCSSQGGPARLPKFTILAREWNEL